MYPKEVCTFICIPSFHARNHWSRNVIVETKHIIPIKQYSSYFCFSVSVREALVLNRPTIRAVSKYIYFILGSIYIS